MAASGPGAGLTRRHFVATLGATALLPLLPAAGPAATAPAMRPLRFFPLADVRLGEGLFARSSDLNLRYLAALDVDRLLAPCRIEAGLPSPAPKYPNWESMGLDGHTAGHYLSALAQQAAQGHAEMRQRLDYMVAAMAQCQRTNGDGYVGGVPGGRVLWERIASGDFQAESFSLEGAWVPFYNLHKTFAGLRDAWLLTICHGGRPDCRHAGRRLAGGTQVEEKSRPTCDTTAPGADRRVPWLQVSIGESGSTPWEWWAVQGSNL
ncbi:beta-L-arabinofuranosidase domain-containing protein [Pseudoxanthomonas sp. J35]|uniref:beta-L-arabinofuranosidase domain-containing protein n=1 Tax=Pseudoxanthomonas sp. J35 TaxID=935852 RepID=UPI00048FF411|nr:beta-L-arabinofuranosidase domain-containing protein [Pseudoxanthomonas sp. J35]